MYIIYIYNLYVYIYVYILHESYSLRLYPIISLWLKIKSISAYVNGYSGHRLRTVGIAGGHF